MIWESKGGGGGIRMDENTMGSHWISGSIKQPFKIGETALMNANSHTGQRAFKSTRDWLWEIS